MKSSQIVTFFFVLAFITVGVFAIVFLYRDYQHLDKLRSEQAILEQKLEMLRAEVSEREETLAKLKGDSEYIEKVIREKLNYAKEGEVIFRFE